MSRATRTTRGALGASVSTLLAAASHALAGGSVLPLALLVTAVLALPICVALAGRIGSLWRISLAVSLSQFFYHWVFAGLGAAGGSPAVAPGLSPHAEHLAQLEAFAPLTGGAAGADAAMWLLHAVAAAVTVAVIARGERAAVVLLRLLARMLPKAMARPAIHPVRVQRASRRTDTLRDRLLLFSPCSRRGPPLLAG